MSMPADVPASPLPFDVVAFLEQSKDVCTVYDTERRFVYLNAAAATLFGRHQDTLVGCGLEEVWGGRTAHLAQCVRQAVETGQVVHVVHKIRSGPGITMYVDMTYTPVRDAAGEVRFVVAVGRDMTDTSTRWRELEDTVARRTRDLSEMESRFDVLVRNLQIGLLIRGPKAELRFCNKRALEMLGMTEDQLRDRVPLDPGWRAVGEDGQELPAEMWPTARAIITGKPVKSMLMGIDRPLQGDRIWMLVNVVFQNDVKGEVEQIIVTFSDATSTRHATEALAEREAMFRALAETITDVFWMTDGDHRQLLYVSPAYETVWGRPRSELASDRLRLLDGIHPDDRERVEHALPLQPVGEYDIEFRVLRPSGDCRWVRERVFPVNDGSGVVSRLVGLASDISAQKQAGEVIRRQADALRELSTPLVPIGDGILAMPLVGMLDSQRVRQVLETLLEGIVRHQSEFVILDVTGVAVVDTQVASALLSATQAARMLGAETLLTGLRPDVAQTIVDLGVDFQGLVTRSTLEMGIRYALQERQKRRAKPARR